MGKLKKKLPWVVVGKRRYSSGSDSEGLVIARVAFESYAEEIRDSLRGMLDRHGCQEFEEVTFYKDGE